MIVRLVVTLLALLFAVPGHAAPRVLLFHRATGFVHDSIPAAVVTLTKIVRERGMEPVASDDPAVFDQPLTYAAIVLVSTTTDPKRPESEWFVGPRQGALQRYVEGGGGIVAIHAAADSHYNWPWYARMIGGRFAQHPPGTPEAEVTRTPHRHPATNGLPDHFRIADEWYGFRDLSTDIDHLLTFDPQSIGAGDVNPKPLAWAHRVGKGRVFYTGLGHRKESWGDPRVLAHVGGALDWATGRRR
ncbi:ThuA domain-containing protein [uncultured Sphingomonas sp.]|uniref:ThuA domain-containing protein n=1 Tax=uncultured Sphingomonas sp. TaxID=158754 RepID=UPI002600A3B6|nr:ThuA domain-containing protein [uncultured Sphingomonas sp.]